MLSSTIVNSGATPMQVALGRGKAQRERINEDTLEGSLPATDEELEAAGLRRQTDYRHDVGLRYS
jgi:hypothetical protein